MKLTKDQTHYALVFAASMAAYLMTLSPTVYAGDSGDFITASYTLGVAHPTGYPLYLILGKIFSYIPYGNIAYRYNLMSAVFASIAAAYVTAAAKSVSKSNTAAVGAGLMVAYSQALWDQATVAEAYALNGAFIAALTYLCLTVRKKNAKKRLTQISVTYGLSLTNHVSMIMYAPAFAYLIHKRLGKKYIQKNVKSYIPKLAAPLILYLYIPAAALTNTVYNWGKPDNLPRLISHITGEVHRQSYVLSLTSQQIFERLFKISWYMSTQMSYAIAFVVLGLYRQGGEQKRLLRFSAILIGFDTLYSLLLNDVSLDITAFGIPTVIVLGLWAALGLEDLVRELGKRDSKHLLPKAGVLLIVLSVLFANYHISDKSQNTIAFDFAMNIMKTLDKNAIVITTGDNVVFPLMYLRHVEGIREDVTVVEESGLLSHEFYGIDYLRLSASDHLLRQKEREFEAIQSGRPVYYTFSPKIDFPGYHTVQNGLIYKMVKDGEDSEVKDYFLDYDMRNIANSTIYIDYMNRQIKLKYYVMLAQQYLDMDKNKVAYLLQEAVKIAPENADLRYDMGTTYLRLGDTKNAEEEFIKSLKRDPENPKALNNLGYIYGMRGEKQKAINYHMAALKINPLYSNARFNLAGLLMSENRLDLALKNYELVIKSEPDYAKAYLNIGVIDYRQGNYQQALDAWEKYLELDPDSDMKAELLNQMQLIKNGDVPKPGQNETAS